MEKEHTINGVAGRLFWNERAQGALFTTQKWIGPSRALPDYDEGARIRPEIRFDDQCGNGHQSFAVTADIYKIVRGRKFELGGGCCHDDIAKAFPELAPLIKWHLCDTRGPMHYEANTVYLAGNRDHWGTLKGEPRAYATMIQFGDNPLKHSFGHNHKFVDFLRGHHPAYDLSVVAIAHKQEGRAGEYQFGPKYTFSGYGKEWHECPFDSEDRARDFLKALQTCRPHFIEVATAWGEGKERELDAARSTACWPDAPDEILCAEPARLRHALRIRLPALIAAFKADMEAAGLQWVEKAPA